LEDVQEAVDLRQAVAGIGQFVPGLVTERPAQESPAVILSPPAPKANRRCCAVACQSVDQRQTGERARYILSARRSVQPARPSTASAGRRRAVPVAAGPQGVLIHPLGRMRSYSASRYASRSAHNGHLYIAIRSRRRTRRSENLAVLVCGAERCATKRANCCVRNTRSRRSKDTG